MDAQTAASQAMIEQIAHHLRATARWTGCGELSPRVRDALLAVPRHRFVPPDRAEIAHADSALAIGHGQTISQPFIVALMTELLDVSPDANVLEVGTGSGYQAAILAQLTRRLCSVEIVPALAREAAARLAGLGLGDLGLGDLGFVGPEIAGPELGKVGAGPVGPAPMGPGDVTLRIGDGAQGWAERAPFDRIMVTAAGGGGARRLAGPACPPWPYGHSGWPNIRRAGAAPDRKALQRKPPGSQAAGPVCSGRHVCSAHKWQRSPGRAALHRLRSPLRNARLTAAALIGVRTGRGQPGRRIA